MSEIFNLPLLVKAEYLYSSPMRNTLLALAVFVPQMTFAGCFTAITIEADDKLYPGQGEVQVCTDQNNQLEKLRVIKPVANPYRKDPNSEQFDERNPTMNISVSELNKSKEIAIMKPKRMGIEITAASISLVNGLKIDPENGGSVALKVLKSKVMGKHHTLILGLQKRQGEWTTVVKRSGEAKWNNVQGLFFQSGMDGIKKIEIQ